MEKMEGLPLESSMRQASISGALKDLTDMETGQRGYLLTSDQSYLQPYTAAKDRIETDFATLRVKLAGRTEGERSLESQLESLVKSKQVEMKRTIDWRQQGYRHRSFMLVRNSGGYFRRQGHEYQEEIKEAATKMERLRQDLVGSRSSEGDWKAA